MIFQKKVILGILVMLTYVSLMVNVVCSELARMEAERQQALEEENYIPQMPDTVTLIIIYPPPDPVVVEEPEPDILLTDEEIELIALITMAEAEAESEHGQRLVIDTILNRVDSEEFPDTVHEVVYQSGQFTCTINGRVDRCYVKEELCNLVREELYSRTNNEVMFFCAGGYGYGNPLFQEGHHFFCGL